MDSNLEYQQNLATLPIGVLVIQAVSTRIEHLEPVVPNRGSGVQGQVLPFAILR